MYKLELQRRQLWSTTWLPRARLKSLGEHTKLSSTMSEIPTPYITIYIRGKASVARARPAIISNITTDVQYPSYLYKLSQWALSWSSPCTWTEIKATLQRVVDHGNTYCASELNWWRTFLLKCLELSTLKNWAQQFSQHQQMHQMTNFQNIIAQHAITDYRQDSYLMPTQYLSKSRLANCSIIQ